MSGEQIMSAVLVKDADGSIAHRMRKCYTFGSSRTDAQGVLFLSDQLVEVLGRAFSSGVNDPHTAMLCLNWLRSGLDCARWAITVALLNERISGSLSGRDFRGDVE